MTEALFDVEAAPEGAGADGPGAILVRVALVTGAGRATVTGRQGDALRVRVGAPLASAMAASAAGAVIAELLGVPGATVAPTGGEDSGHMRRGSHAPRALVLRVTGVDAEEAGRLLELAADGGASTGGPRGGNVGASGGRRTH